ncbi:MAG: hypothetical protein AB1505_04570 [Candidatus Latescibacterota bacterium]
MPEQDLEERIRAVLAVRRAGRDGRPLVIGIGGGSASGKSTLARQLGERLAPLHVEVVGQDRFFKSRDELPPHVTPHRATPWPDYNRPDSFRTAEMFAHCRNLDGCDVAVVEGILVLYYPEMRQAMDLRLYVAADADERIVRRIRRNVAAGMALDGIADYYLESVRRRHAEFNEPTRQHADLVIPGGMADAQEREEMVQALCRAVRACCGAR